MEQRIQATMRIAASRNRETIQVGSFLATFTDHSTNPYLNYAIPNDGAIPTPTEVTALIKAFAEHGRVPRLEYVSTVAPAVEGVLVREGFTIIGRLPLMICLPDQVSEIPSPSGIEIVMPVSDDDIYALVLAQNEAYDGEPPTTDDVARHRHFLRQGGISFLARDITTGAPAGGGLCNVPVNGATELTSVGVRVAYRRRGIAAALTSRLTRAAYATGLIVVFLMAAGEAEARIYQRVGFATIGEVLDLRTD